jgi:hypothetical protein
MKIVKFSLRSKYFRNSANGSTHLLLNYNWLTVYSQQALNAIKQFTMLRCSLPGKHSYNQILYSSHQSIQFFCIYQLDPYRYHPWLLRQATTYFSQYVVD